MSLYEMIFKRKSCRSFLKKDVDAETIEKILAFEPKALYPQISVRTLILEREQVKCVCPWTTSQLLAIYSEETEGYLENVGFLFQQMDLYLHTLGLGVCWLGLARLNPKKAPAVEGMKFVIMLGFGYPKGEQLRKDVGEFKRNSLVQISDQEDIRLEPARLAPSGVNSQPWYFAHEGDTLHVYCSHKGSPIDAGIAISHLYVANPETFRFFKAEHIPKMDGHDYIGSVTL